MKSLKRYLFLTIVGLAISAGPAYLGAAPIVGHIKNDNFGYRTTDTKLILFTANPGASVGIYNAATSVLVASASPVSQGKDTGSPAISGDTVWSADFSSVTTAGTYYVYSLTLNEQSYNFQISDCIYQSPMTATLKALYYQRCGTPKPAAYAGANWADASACHTGDATCGPAPGCSFPMAYGTLNLSGGWHDAGDYNKYIGTTPTGACNSWGGDGGSALHYMLSTYEWNPGLFTDGLTNIPESGNGVSDLLDEAKWELDWYLKMQMNDKHILSVVHQTVYTTGSPPSTDATTRYYYPPNPTGEAAFVAVLSHAARVMSGIPALAGYAVTLRTAAEATWNTWVASSAASDQKFWAAAEIFRMEQALGGPASIITAAQTLVDGYKTWSGLWLNENQDILNWGMLAYMQATGATASVVTNMKADWGNLAGDIFNQAGLYGSGMHSYDYFWGANQIKMDYGLELVWAAKLASTGTHTAVQCLAQAENYLHYMDGLNPLNMTYMTNSNALGAAHGIWRIYHSWFGNYGVAFSFNNFIGKPASVVDPLYPYYTGPDNYGISDSGPSAYGPPPGIVPDGASDGYKSNNGLSQPPLLAGGIEPPYEKEYRDWDYADPSGNQTIPWVVNETGIYYISSYNALASVFAAPCAVGTPTPTPTNTASNTPTKTFTNSPTNTPTNTPGANTNTATNSPTRTATNTPTNSSTKTPTSTSTNTPTNSLTSTFTNTVTMTATNSPTRTPTNTPTNSPINTATNTPTNTPNAPTNTPTNSPTRTPTFTPTHSPTNSPTLTSTQTVTLTFTRTSTSTPTNSPSNTCTNSPTNTSTNSPTTTPTNSATRTPTATPTNSLTNSPTNSPTRTPTNSPTNSPSNTPSNTPTVTSTPTNSPTGTLSPSDTPTFSSTVTNSPTKTLTSTATYSPTNTSTNTPSSTPTNSLTNSPTNSPTRTPSNTPTNSPSGTPTNSPTSSATKTPTPTITNTATNTPMVTNTATNTPTFTATNTPSNTPSKTPTLTPTNTPVNTNTATNSPTLTPSLTSTPDTVQFSAGSPAPPDTTQLPGASNAPVLSVVLTNLGTTPVNFTSLTVSDNGTGTASGISGINLLNNGNPVAGPVGFAGSTSTFSGLSVNIPASGSVTLQVTVNFSNAALAGTYQFSVTGGAGTNGQPVNFTGLPSSGATVTIAFATATPTNSPTSTVSYTQTQTPTLTMTAPGTPLTGKIVLYPNPADGTQPVSLRLNLTSTSHVEVQIFTTAFRKVLEEAFPRQPAGVDVGLNLVDQWGTPLASGLYYVVVTVDGHRSILKLLILR